MKHRKLQRLILLALCCDPGLFTKRLIAPAANILTDSLHISGGTGTSRKQVSAIVLAGGRSSRMGRDKAKLFAACRSFSTR